MRNAIALLAVVVSLSACSSKDGVGGRGPNSPDVRINVVCPSNAVHIDVDPFVATVPAGQPITWNIVAAANVTQLTINAEPAGTWPFTEAPPITVSPGSPGSARTRIPGWVPGTTARYSITGICQGPGGAQYSFTLDPDMIVN